MLSLLQQTAPAAVTETTQTVVETSGQASDNAVVTTTETTTVAAETAGHDAHATHTMTGAPEHQATGMPQLDFSTYGNQIFWLVIALVAIFLILSRVALPRIGRILADRQGLMTGDLMAAEEFKKKAKDAEAAYEKALADARGEAQKIVAANKAAIDAELKGAIAKADAEISARTAESEVRIREIRARAVDDARTVAQDVAAELVSRFGVAADGTALSQAVEARMKGTQQ